MLCSSHVQCLRTYLPWICTSIALGYATYIHWKYRKSSKSKRINENKDTMARSLEVNIDNIDRNVSKKKISYCRCWKSKTFPYCDGAHKQHNKECDDQVGPLNIVWDGELQQQESASQTSPKTIDSGSNDGMDIKSIDSGSPTLEQSLHEDSNGDFDQIVRINDDNLSSIEMIDDDNFATISDANISKDNSNKSG